MSKTRNEHLRKFTEQTRVIRLPETLATFLQQYPSVVKELVSQIKDGEINLNIDVTALQPVTANYAFDFDTKINDAVTSAIAPLLARIETLENVRSEATAPANFTSTSESQGSSAPNIAESIIEPLPIIEAIATDEDPIGEPQSRQNLTELSESAKANVLDNVKIQSILDETLTEAIASTAKPKATKRSAKSKFYDGDLSALPIKGKLSLCSLFASIPAKYKATNKPTFNQGNIKKHLAIDYIEVYRKSLN